MLIPGEIVQKYLRDYKISGVLHVGAHECEELPFYESLGLSRNDVIWLDAQASKVSENVQRGIPNVFLACVSDSDDTEVVFNVTNNSQSSSILELGTHAVHYPGIWFVDKVVLKTTKIDTFLLKNGFQSSKYNFWNLDIQGAELLALKGASTSLQHVDAIYMEVNTEFVYVDGALITELDEYLQTFGLHRVYTDITGAGWGDALYLKQRRFPMHVKSSSDVEHTAVIQNEEYAVIKSFMDPGSVVFDVGGNAGEWTDLALLQDPSHIHVFEPLPLLGASLAKKYSSFTNITVNSLALSDSSGVSEYQHYEHCDKLSGFHVRKVLPQQPAKISVPYIPLSTYCAERGIKTIGFLKIDTEGHEYAVLKGSASMLPHIDYIQFEYGGTYPDSGTTLKQVFDFLSAFGFKMFRLMEDTSLQFCPKWLDHMEDYAYSNYLAVSASMMTRNEFFARVK